MIQPEIIVMGMSAGGLEALVLLLQYLPTTFSVPVAVVQHRSSESPRLLLQVLRSNSRHRFREPFDREPVIPGSIYIAPADYHLILERGEFRLSTEDRVRFARPSIDVLFESASDAYGNRTVGVVLTGASSDGAWGSACIKRAGGVIIVQSPAESESPAMPRAVLAATDVDRVLSLSDIGPFLVSLCQGVS